MPTSDASLKSLQRILRSAHELSVQDLRYLVGRLEQIIESKLAAAAKGALIRDLGAVTTR